MDDTTPGSAVSLEELHRRVPAARELDAPLSDGQVVGLVEHLLGAVEVTEEG
jgi:hypothetical protein